MQAQKRNSRLHSDRATSGVAVLCPRETARVQTLRAAPGGGSAGASGAAVADCSALPLSDSRPCKGLGAGRMARGGRRRAAALALLFVLGLQAAAGRVRACGGGR